MAVFEELKLPWACHSQEMPTSHVLIWPPWPCILSDPIH